MNNCGMIYIGKVGENLVTEYVFPDYESFPATLSYQRQGDEAPYPVELTQAAGGWLWTVTATDLAVPGWGKAEVVYTEGDKIKKSDTYTVVATESLSPAGEVPDAWKSYYDDIIAAGSAAVGNAESAAESATSAAESASKAADYADKAEQAAADAGFMEFEINGAGHLIYTRTDSVDSIDFRLSDGHLLLEVS